MRFALSSNYILSRGYFYLRFAITTMVIVLKPWGYKSMTKLQDVLRSARLKRGLSHREVEKLADKKITATYVRIIENKEVIPSPEKLRVLADILQLDFLELMILAGHVCTSDLGTR